MFTVEFQSYTVHTNVGNYFSTGILQGKRKIPKGFWVFCTSTCPRFIKKKQLDCSNRFYQEKLKSDFRSVRFCTSTWTTGPVETGYRTFAGAAAIRAFSCSETNFVKSSPRWKTTARLTPLMTSFRLFGSTLSLSKRSTNDKPFA